MKNWFHLFCLSHCNVALPKRSQDQLSLSLLFLVPWKHFKYINTCTSVTIFSLTCLQDNSFFGKIGFSKAESILKAALTEISQQGNFVHGKTMLLDFIQDATGNAASVNCWGGEYSKCLVVFRNTWKVTICQSMQCSSSFCQKPTMKSRYPVGFSLYQPALSGTSFEDQIADQFPIIGMGYGYCGEKFDMTPPKDAFFEVVQVELVGESRGVYEEKCECRGVPITQACGFISAPWILPFDITQFSP